MSRLGGTSHSINPDLLTGDDAPAPGAPGADGQDGEGVPAGGTAGQVLKKQSATDFDTAWETDAGGAESLDDLTDVSLTAPADGEVLTYETASGMWKNQAASGGGGSDNVIATEELTVAGTSIEITGLSNLAEVDVELLMPDITGTAAAQFCYVNGDTTAANYRTQNTQSRNAANTAAEYDDGRVGRVDGYIGNLTIGKLRVVDGFVMGFFDTVSLSSVSDTFFDQTAFVKETTESDLTAVRFESTTNFPIGTKLILRDPGQGGGGGGGAPASTAVQLATFVQGVPGDGEKILSYVTTDAFDLPTGLSASQAYADVTATAAATIDIQKNGVSIGSIDFAIGSNTATFTFASAQSFAAGDRIQFINQGTADATLSDIAITLRGTTT